MSITDGDLAGDRTIDGAWRFQTDEDPGFVVALEQGASTYKVAFRVDSADGAVLEVDSAGEVGIKARDAGAVPLYIVGVSDHSSPLLRIFKSGSTDLFRIDADGSVHVKPGAVVEDL